MTYETMMELMKCCRDSESRVEFETRRTKILGHEMFSMVIIHMMDEKSKILFKFENDGVEFYHMIGNEVINQDIGTKMTTEHMVEFLEYKLQLFTMAL